MTSRSWWYKEQCLKDWPMWINELLVVYLKEKMFFCTSLGWTLTLDFMDNPSEHTDITQFKTWRGTVAKNATLGPLVGPGSAVTNRVQLSSSELTSSSNLRFMASVQWLRKNFFEITMHSTPLLTWRLSRQNQYKCKYFHVHLSAVRKDI